eukprot:g3608.t1
MTSLDSPDLRTELSSVWSCFCNAPIRDILISQQGVVAIATDSSITLYAGAPNFGDSHSLSSSPAHLTAYSFSADGTHFLTGDSNGFLKWWDVHNGDETGATQFPFSKLNEADEMTNSPPSITDIKCSKESELVATSAGSTLCIYGHGGLLLHTIGPLEAQIKSIEWNTGNQLAVNIGTAICMMTVTPEEFILGHQYPAEINQGILSTLSCPPDGSMLAGTCTHGDVRVWDLASDQNGEISVFVKEFPNSVSGSSSSVQCLTWDSTGHFLAAAGDSDVIVWDMKDSENEESKDNSIICYGHGQRAKITALKFQPNGGLLATGDDDCQVLVFDSDAFASTGLVNRLVGCSVSGRVARQSDASITALAWHPLGLILAGTSKGLVDAFEVASTVIKEKTPTANFQTTQVSHQTAFLFPKGGIPSSKRINSRHPAGWGGEPLITKGNDDFSNDKFIRRPKLNGNVNNSAIRMSTGKPKVYQGKFKPNPRPYSERPPPAGGNWQSTVPGSMMGPTMVHWGGGYSHQVPPPPYMSPYGAPPNHSTPNPPHTPESTSSESNGRNGQPPNNTQTHQGRNERNMNRTPMVKHHQNENLNISTGAVPHQAYSMGYLPFHGAYPMGYAPTPYGYYPVPGGVPPGTPHVPMTATVPPVRDQHGHQTLNKAFQTMRVASGAPSGAPEGTGMVNGSPELDEELGSKSSEAVNNGVQNGSTPVSVGGGVVVGGVDSSSSINSDGRGSQGQTLYIGNLAIGVEENLLMHYFSPYGPIVNVQVIRDRDTHISRGFGFVTFAHPFYAQTAMQHMDSIQIPGPFEGRRLKVSFSNRR